MHLSKYIKTYPCRENPAYLLLFSTRWFSKIRIPYSVMQVIEQGTLSLVNEQTLSRLGFLVHDRDAERQEMLNAMVDANRRSKKCHITAVLNLDCNLACLYCFEGNRKGKHYMSDETADVLVNFATQKYIHHGKDLCMDFYGGEPLLSLDLIRDMSRKLKHEAENSGVEYSFTLVTNGTLLTAKVAEELTTLGLKSVKITLDGPRENHDNWRPFISGKGSFDVIIKNIKDICGLVKVQTGGNYSRDNYREVVHLLDVLLAEGLTPDRLSTVIFAPITKTLDQYVIPEFSEGCSSGNEPWLIEASRFLREEILRRGFKTPLVAPAICVIESNDSLIVNYDGTLFKCPAFIGCEGLDVGDLWNGIKDYRESHNLDAWKNDECLDCAYLPLCFGGCRFLKLIQDGAIDGVECRKAFLDSTLEPFILQDLKYGRKINS